MQTIVMRDQQLQLEQVDTPEPGPGQVLVKSLACGICGSDLHILRHADEVFELYAELGVVEAGSPDGGLEINLGHEFSAEIVRYGPATRGELPVGSRVTSVPFLLSGGEQLGIGTMPGNYGAYSEYFLLSEDLLLPIPDAVPSEVAALTEPLAVGLHAVNHAQPAPGDAALVAGCGPIGLACIAALKRAGVQAIIASDPQPHARELAREFGATHCVNPMEEDEFALAASLAESGRVVALECVGLPRMIPDFIKRAPEAATIVFTGLHTGDITIAPAHATVKQLDLKFSYYYTPEEYAECLQALGEGDIPWQHMITGKVGIDGVNEAFAALSGGSQHTKIVIEPWRTGALEPFIAGA